MTKTLARYAARRETRSLNITRRGFLRTAGMLTTGAFASSCDKSSLPSLGNEQHHKIAGFARKYSSSAPLRVFYPKGCLGNLTPVVAQFEALTGQNVDLLEASLDEISAEIALNNQIKATNAFDVALPATFALPDLIEAGALEPLDEMHADYASQVSAAAPLYSHGDKYKGIRYGFQTDGDVYSMFYLKDWLADPDSQKRYADKWGHELAVPKTWEELDRQLAFFHVPDNKRYGGTLFRNRAYIGWEFWVRLHAKGVFPVGYDLQPRFSQPEALQALEELVAASSFLDPQAASHGLFANFSSFADGTKYCNIGWGGTQKYLHQPSSPVRDKLTHAMLPGGVLAGEVVPMPYFNWGWNFVVSARSRRKQLAYLFSLFAVTPAVSTQAVRESSGYFDPYLTVHYDDKAVQNSYGADFLRVHRQGIESCIPDFYLRGQSRYFAALKHAVYAASRGQIQPKKALIALNDKWNHITDELGRNGQTEQWRFLRSLYPEKLRAKLR